MGTPFCFEQSSPLSTCSFLVLGEVFLYRPYSKLLSKRSGRPYYHGQETPTSHEGWGGRPVTKSTATLPMGVGVWVYPYHPLKRDSGLGQASLSRQRCLRRDTGTKGVI